MRKGESIIFRVGKEEADYIRQHSKQVRITITGKGKNSRNKKWFVDESDETYALLEEYWANKIVHH